MHEPDDMSVDALTARLAASEQEKAALQQQIQELQPEADRNKAAVQAVAIQADSAVTREEIKADAKIEEVQAKAEADSGLGAQKAAFEERLSRQEDARQQAHDERMAELEGLIKLAIEGLKANAKSADAAEQGVRDADEADKQREHEDRSQLADRAVDSAERERDRQVDTMNQDRDRVADHQERSIDRAEARRENREARAADSRERAEDRKVTRESNRAKAKQTGRK